MTTIQKIRAEIERRITDNIFEAKLELIDILAWLDTLESEKPVPDDLEEAAEEYATDTFPITNEVYVDYPRKSAFIAGAEWQKEQDLAEMAQSKSPLSIAYANRCFENGKQAMKEQMLKEAVAEVEVGMHGEPIEIILDKYVQRSMGIFPGDKVRIIIVKEDEK